MTDDPDARRYELLLRYQREMTDPDLNVWTRNGTTVHGEVTVTDPDGQDRTITCPECGRARGLRVTLLAQVRCPCGARWIDPVVTVPFAHALNTASDAVRHPAEDQIVNVRQHGEGVEATVDPRT